MKVLVKKSNEKAVMPFKTYKKDFCYDVVATSAVEIAPNVWKYGIGLAFQIERDNEFIGKDLVSSKTWVAPDGTIREENVIKPLYFDFDYAPIVLSIGLRPRSSVWKTGMVLSNCEGTIDELYTGEVSAVFYHVMPNMPKYEVGDRIGQIYLNFTLPMDFEEVDELDETQRGANGYGSTGK